MNKNNKSRKLKFRIWDKLTESFIYCEDDNQQHFILDLNGNFHNLQNGSGGDEYVVQEYTGLIDKNCNPIYEDDIVKWGGLNYLVEWNDIAYKWQGRCPYYHPHHHPTTEHFRDLMNGIVVGNIFEHSELLK